MANVKNKKKTAGAAKRTVFPLWRTCLIFFAAILAFNLVEWLLLKPWQVEILQVATAKTVSVLLDGFGLKTQLSGTQLFFSGGHWEIVAECTALQAMYVFVAFIVAYPSSSKTKGIGILLGLPLLFFANILRLLMLAWAIQLIPDYAGLVHDYVWQIAFLFLLVLMWLGWIDLVVNREKVSAVSM